MPTYRVEYHRVWVKTIEAASRKEARQVAEDEMNEDADAEDYNYSVVSTKHVAALEAAEKNQ